MSRPIVMCRFWQAARHQAAFDRLVEDLVYNLQHGSMLIVPCEHKPACKTLNLQQLEVLDERLGKALALRRSGPCRATFELANGETVTPCCLPQGHQGDHQGSCLGSKCSWPQGCTSEEELHL